MSGIAGVVATGGVPLDAALPHRMAAFMAYRGPDAQSLDHDHTEHVSQRSREDDRYERECVRDGEECCVDARTDVLQGLGHWWMTQDPEHGAEVLTRFWNSP